MRARIVFSVFMALLAASAYLLLDRRKVVEALSIQFVSSPVYAGKPVTIRWSVIEYRHGCGGRVYPRWVDSNGVIHDSPSDPIPERLPLKNTEDGKQANSDDLQGMRQFFERPRIVPVEMAPGEAIFAPKAKRWCNSLQQWLWPMDDDSLPRVRFMISAPPL